MLPEHRRLFIGPRFERDEWRKLETKLAVGGNLDEIIATVRVLLRDWRYYWQGPWSRDEHRAARMVLAECYRRAPRPLKP